MSEKIYDLIKESGVSIRAIARALEVNESTVRYHLRHPEETAKKRQIRSFLRRVGRQLRGI